MRRRSRTSVTLAIAGLLAGAALTVRQRQLARNAKRFGLPT